MRGCLVAYFSQRSCAFILRKSPPRLVWHHRTRKQTEGVQSWAPKVRADSRVTVEISYTNIHNTNLYTLLQTTLCTAGCGGVQNFVWCVVVTCIGQQTVSTRIHHCARWFQKVSKLTWLQMAMRASKPPSFWQECENALARIYHQKHKLKVRVCLIYDV